MKTKKLISMLLASIMMLSYLPLAQMTGIDLGSWFIEANAAEEVQTGKCGSLTWTLNTDTGELVISGTGEIPSYLELPWIKSTTVKSVSIEKGVTSIGSSAFSECKALTNVVIPNTVTSIGDEAFYGCTNLVSITIPDSVTSIGMDVFRSCESLANIVIPDSVTNIGGNIITNTAYISDSSNWENGVLYIGNHLICAETSVSGDYEIKIGTKTIAESAFMDCSSLTGVKIPDSVTNIGYNAFFETAYYNDSSNWENGVLYIDNHLICAKASVSGDYKIKSETKTIANHAFSECKAITSITVDQENTAYSSDEYGVLFNKDKTELIQYPIGNTRTNYEIPDSVTRIGNSAFGFCNALTSIVIPDNVTNIGYAAFCFCDSLTSITIGSGVANINFGGIYVDPFDACKSLTSITVDQKNTTYSSDEYGVLFNKDKTELIQYPIGNTRTNYEIPDNTTKICNRAFDSCKALTNILVPNSVTSIGHNAFSFCDSLASITIPDSVISIGYDALWDCDSLANITVDQENIAYSSDEYGVLFNKDKTELIQYPIGNTRTTYEIPDSVTRVGDTAFAFCNALTSIVIPNSVTSIGAMTFTCCTALEYVHIPASVTLINDNALTCTTACICSDTEDCYAKTYAENWGIDFTLCTGHNAESKFGTDSDTSITYTFANGTFDYNGEIGFKVEAKDKKDFEESFRGYVDESDDIFFYKIKFYAKDKDGNYSEEIQPSAGKKVKIGFPIPEGYETANTNLFMVLHKRSDNGKLEFFMHSNNNIEIKNGYIYIWTDNFSPFALVINYTESKKIVSSISIASLPTKTSYTYKSGNLDLSGLALTVTYSDGSTETVTDTSKMEVTGFDNGKTGTQIVTVEYEGVTAKFDVTVSYAWWQWIIRILLLGFLWY